MMTTTLLARADHVDELEAAAADDVGPPHDGERLAAVAAGPRRRRVAAMPCHLRVEHLADRVKIAA